MTAGLHRRGDPLFLGREYRTQAGELVVMRSIHHAGSEYETMKGSDGVHRYSRRPDDAGRVTGTDHDYSDPKNLKVEGS